MRLSTVHRMLEAALTVLGMAALFAWLWSDAEPERRTTRNACVLVVTWTLLVVIQFGGPLGVW